MGRTKKLTMLSILALMLVVAAVATKEEDEKECADQLANLAACIPFVSGAAKKPTQQCCNDTQKVKSAKPKYLCVLIKESTDPSMGLNVNTTLALQMPSACNIDAKVSNCPCNFSNYTKPKINGFMLWD
ncbi:Protein YLS3 [Camellia lanceoleosa]|nr:Protein YLS3 [Camellia lanceoleosa]